MTGSYLLRQLRRRDRGLKVSLATMVLLTSGCVAPVPRSHIVPAAKLTWTDVLNADHAPLGLRTAEVWGTPSKGAHASLTKFPGGFAEPLHRHSHPIRVVVLSGTMRFVVDDVESVDLGPPSYVAVAADVPHFARCIGPAACEVLIEQDAAMDVKLGAK